MATLGIVLAVIAIMMSSFLMGCYLVDRGIPVKDNREDIGKMEEANTYREVQRLIRQIGRSIPQNDVEDDEEDEDEQE